MAVIRTSSRATARRFRRPSVKSRPSTVTRLAVSRVPRNVFGFPRHMITTIKYVDAYSIGGSAGSAGGNIMRLNSAYDPDYTGLGHQPMYYDNFTPIYNKYVVMSSTIKVDFSPLNDDTESTTAGPWAVGLTPSSTTSFSNVPSTLSEQNGSVTTLIGRDKGTSVRSLSLDYNPMRDLGTSTSDDTLSANNGGNPSRPWHCYVWAADLNNTNGLVRAYVTVTYRVKFFDQAIAPPS